MATMDITPETNQNFPLQMWAMNLGMYEVTADNWSEFFVRIRLYAELIDGPLLKYVETNKPVEITPELAKQHIGCRLGGMNEERGAWWLRLMKSRARELEYAVEKFDPSVEFPRTDEDDEL
ncbi:hypothetical protein [Streptomyces sp. NPDC017448]|uniref:hypothetical protein n=1 Tax=Streptomyces sp. NPDC017448 TaxID=3364996 RepID=UPI0037B42F00